MAQEKQNNVRILQAKHKKAAKKPLMYLSIGFLAGVFSTCLVLFAYSSFNSKTIEHASQAQMSDQDTQQADDIHQQTASMPLAKAEKQTQESDHPGLSAQDEQDENFTKVKEEELRQLFNPAPQITSKQAPSASKTPFENVFGDKSTQKNMKDQATQTSKGAAEVKSKANPAKKDSAKDKSVETPKPASSERVAMPRSTDVERIAQLQAETSPPASTSISITQSVQEK